MKKIKSELFLVFLIQLLFIATRFIYYQSPYVSHDHGNHLLIAKFIARGGLPYREFAVTHMPGLYLPLVLGFWISESLFFPMLFYFLIVSFIIPLSYQLFKEIFKNKIFAFFGLILFFTDPLLTIYSKVTTYDCLALPFLLAAMILLQKKRLQTKDYLLMTGIYFITFFIKLTTVYFLGFLLGLNFLVYFYDRQKRKEITRLIVIQVVITAVSLLLLNRFMPYLTNDVFSAHLKRFWLPVSSRISELFSTFSYSLVNLLSGFLVAIFWLFSKNKQAKLFSLFFLMYLLFSVFVPHNFWRHHLIFLIPIGSVLILFTTEKMINFLKEKNWSWRLLILSTGLVVLGLHFFFWYTDLTYFNPEIEKLYEKAKKLPGQLFANSNYSYIVTEKEPYFWYYVTVPDVPCRCGNCTFYKDILTKSDFALLDTNLRWKAIDENFADYLYRNFYLDLYDSRTGRALYRRR
ncbi:MAG TPA: hypothetical protein VMW41_04110 [Candidatus Bathyarchaeia archaeon]|nr:hypothetical protein [Candidatus Bathyarchaeia archaeon]